MKMKLLVLLCLVALVTAEPYKINDGGVAHQVTSRPGTSGQDSGFLCSAEGYFGHPTDPNRFYRCVDHAKTGQVYSTYEFRCPAQQVFVKTAVDGICVPVKSQAAQGNADGSSSSGASTPDYSPPSTSTTTSPPAQGSDTGVVGGGSYPGPDAAAQPSQAPPVITEAPYPPAPAVTVAQPTSPPPIIPSGGSYPQPGSSNSNPPVSNAPSNGYPGPGACPAKYVQDKMYCNVYETCPSDGNKYRCDGGSVFDPNTQKCIFQSTYPARIDVCNGKTLMSQSLFRSSFSVRKPVSKVEPGLFQAPVQVIAHDLSATSFDQSSNVVLPNLYVGFGPGTYVQNPDFYTPEVSDQPAENIVVKNSNANVVPTFFPSASNPLVFYY